MNGWLLDDHLDLRSSLFTFGNESTLSFRSLNHNLLAVLDDDTLVSVVNLLACEVVAGSVSLLGNGLDGLNTRDILLALASIENVLLETNLGIALEQPVGLACLGINDDVAPERLVAGTDYPRLFFAPQSTDFVVRQELLLSNLFGGALSSISILLTVVLAVDVTLYQIRSCLLGLTINQEGGTVTLVSPDAYLQRTVGLGGKLVVETALGFTTRCRVKSRIDNAILASGLALGVNFLSC